MEGLWVDFPVVYGYYSNVFYVYFTVVDDVTVRIIIGIEVIDAVEYGNSCDISDVNFSVTIDVANYCG